MYFRKLIAAALLLNLLIYSTAFAEDPKLVWTEGAKTVELGKVANFDLGSDFIFLDAENTKNFMKLNGDIPKGNEIGSVLPKDPNQHWSVFFDYTESGHIKDDEKEKIDADAILKSYKKGTEEANKNRPAEARLYVTGWDIKPFYDEKTHYLNWSLLAEDAQKQTLLNYNVRLLTRTGYISAILVSDPQHRDADHQMLSELILPKLIVKAEQRYEDFNAATDKISEYGLSALILGGAGIAIAKKVGLLATVIVLAKKFWFILAIAAGAGWKFLKRLVGRKNDTETTANQ